MTAKTILHICDWHHPCGGAEKLMFDVLDSLEERGVKNVVAYLDDPAQKPTGKRPEHPIKDLDLYSYWDPDYRIRAKAALSPVLELVERYKPDLCHLHNFQNHFVVEGVAGRLPTMRSVHDPRLYCFTDWKLLPDGSICRHPLGPECVKQGCLSGGFVPRTHYDRNAQAVLEKHKVHKTIHLIAESRAQIDCLLDNGFDPDKLHWLPNFTPIAPKDEVERVNAEFFDPDDPIVLAVARASKEKGLSTLIEAMRRVTAKVRAVIVTAGPLLAEIEAQAAPLGGKVTVIPGLPYEETATWYARAHVTVIPSVWLENFCLVGIETFAKAKPVIASAEGGILDWMQDGETGLLFKTGDADDLAQKIDSAFADPKRLERWGENAYARAAKFYNKNLYMDRLTRIYERVTADFRRA